MPSTVSKLLESVKLEPKGVFQWADIENWLSNSLDTYCGVYFISLSGCPSSNDGLKSAAPVCRNSVTEWLERVTQLKIDGHRPNSPDEIVTRLNEFWLPDENILYIGESNSIKQRIQNLHVHQIGYSSPHSGGHWIQLLSNLDNLYIHYADASNHNEITTNIKYRVLAKFMENASAHIDRNSRIANCALPFANISTKGCKKSHGFRNHVIKR